MENYEGNIEVRGDYSGGPDYLVREFNEMMWTASPSQFLYDSRRGIYLLHRWTDNPTVFPTRQSGPRRDGATENVPVTLEELAEILSNSIQDGSIQIVAEGYAENEECEWYMESLYYDSERHEAFRASMYQTDSFGLICATEYGSEKTGYPNFRLPSSKREVVPIVARIEHALAMQAESASIWDIRPDRFGSLH